MGARDLLLDSILHEIDVIKFLGTKVPPDRLDWRPTPGQRSLRELLRYLTICGHRVAQVVLSGDWELRARYEAEARKVELESFADAMDRQAVRLRELCQGIDDWDREVQLPWGPRTTVEGLLLNATLKFLVAYRMQLFLYLKGLGLRDLGTHECWFGRDRPPAGT